MIHMVRYTLSQFAKDTRGAVFIMVAFGISALLASVGLAVEASHYMQMKSKVRNALDQALLAAASTSSDIPTMQQTMNKFFAANLGSAEGVEIIRLVVRKETANDSWSADVDVKVDTNFAGIMGIDSLTMHHEAAVKWDDHKQKEIVAMMDISGTMCATFDRTAGVTTGFMQDNSCLKLQKMREALKKIVEIGVSPGQVRPIYKLGIVPYTHKVRLPVPATEGNVGAHLLTNEVAKDYYTNLAEAEEGATVDGVITKVPLPAVKPLRSIRTDADIEAFKADVDSLFSNDFANQEFTRPFMKRSALGAHISALMLDPQYHALFVGGEMPNPFGMRNNEKIIIIMTDSANLGCCYTSFEGDFRNNYIYSYRDDQAHLVGDGRTHSGICSQMKAAGYTVFTVLLDVSNDDVNEPNNTIEHFEKCATEGNNYRIPLYDQKALEEAYKQIGAKIKHLRLTY